MGPITKLVKKAKMFKWTAKCQIVWEDIKNRYIQATILISLNWKLEFHVHTDASQLVVGAILAQNPTSKIDQHVMYSSRLFNFVEKNYTITKKEALALIYALHKFRHHLLNNMFTFFVDHMALIYLVNKPHVFGRLVRWLLLFLEYDFKIVYKPGRSQLMANALNRLPNHTEPIAVPNQTCDVHFLPYNFSGYKTCMNIYWKE
jgi:hypothetical protein